MNRWVLGYLLSIFMVVVINLILPFVGSQLGFGLVVTGSYFGIFSVSPQIAVLVVRWKFLIQRYRRAVA
jgi:hypothetical protein